MEQNSTQTVQKILAKDGEERDHLLERFWEKFMEVPKDQGDNLEEDFFIWHEGTAGAFIWEWFDKRHTGGVDHLTFGKAAQRCSLGEQNENNTSTFHRIL